MDINIVLPRNFSFHRFCGRVIFTKSLVKEGIPYLSTLCPFYTQDSFSSCLNLTLVPEFSVRQTTWGLSKTEFNVFILCVCVLCFHLTLREQGLEQLVVYTEPSRLRTKLILPDVNEKIVVTPLAFSSSPWIKVKAEIWFIIIFSYLCISLVLAKIWCREVICSLWIQ